MKNVIGDFDKDEVLKILDIYQADKSLGLEMMIKKLERYITQMMYSPKYCEYARNANLRDDIRQQIYVEIMVAMDNYDIDKGAPVTYFKPFIQAGIRKVIDTENGFTSYYSSICRKIRQLQSVRAKKNLSISIDDCILAFPEISPTTIKEAFRQMYATDNSFSLDGSLKDDSSYELPFESTPESVAMEKEDNRVLYESINDVLTEQEKCVTVLTYCLFRSDFAFLLDILQNSAKYSDIELIKANGYTGAKLFQYLGFSIPEYLQYLDVTKEKADLFYHIVKKNDMSKEEAEFVSSVQAYIQSEFCRTKGLAMTTESLVEFMKEIGYSKQQVEEKLLTIKSKISLLKTPQQITDTDALLRAKGFSASDIEKIYTGKKISQNKISIILGISTQEVKTAISNSERKLKKTLALAFPERSARNNMYKDMLNEESIPTTHEAESYAAAFLEQLNEMEWDV